MARTLAELLEERLGTQAFPRTNPVTSSVGTTAEAVLSNNPNRVAFLIVNLSSNTIYIMMDNQVSSTRGIRLAPNGGQAVVVWDEDFSMVGWEWFAVATGAGSNILVLEMVTQ